MGHGSRQNDGLDRVDRGTGSEVVEIDEVVVVVSHLRSFRRSCWLLLTYLLSVFFRKTLALIKRIV